MIFADTLDQGQFKLHRAPYPRCKTLAVSRVDSDSAFVFSQATLDQIVGSNLNCRRPDLNRPDLTTARPARRSPTGAKSGPDRDRTDDLLTASQALSQLSYGPLKKIETPENRNARK